MEKDCGHVNGTAGAAQAGLWQGDPGDGVIVGLVNRERVELVWPEVEGYIVQTLRESILYELPIDELKARIADGKYLLLVVELVRPDWQLRVTAAAVLSVSLDGLGRKYVCMLAVGGEHVELWLEALTATVKHVAVMAQAERVVAVGRQGWVRLMRELGVRQQAAVFSLDITADDVARVRAGERAKG
jgi:hypothetical protein